MGGISAVKVAAQFHLAVVEEAFQAVEARALHGRVGGNGDEDQKVEPCASHATCTDCARLAPFATGAVRSAPQKLGESV